MAGSYAAAIDQSDQYHDHRNDEQDVDEAAQGIGRHEAEQPQDQQDNSDCI
jgi:hypothetical protein